MRWEIWGKYKEEGVPFEKFGCYGSSEVTYKSHFV